MKEVRSVGEFDWREQEACEGGLIGVIALAIAGLASYAGYASGGWVGLGYSSFCLGMVVLTVLSIFVNALRGHDDLEQEPVAENMYLIWFVGTIFTITLW